MNRSKKSKVWMFFKDSEEQHKAECILCNALISRGGKGKLATTSSLMNHIKGKHPISFKELNGPIDKSQEEDIIEVDYQNPSKKTKIQQNIIESFSQWDDNDNRSKELHYAIGEMIAVDNQPISIVENCGFVRLLKKMKPKYKLPSRKHLTDVIIPDIYHRTKNVLKKQITQAPVISATTDMWNDDNNLQSFLSLTIHWIGEDFTRKHCVLEMKYFPGQHTSNNIRTVIGEILRIWEILPEKVHVILRDNGANIVKALNDSPYIPIPCFIHTLQVINDAIYVQENVSEMIATSRRIVTHFHHSEIAQEKLKEHQRQLGLPPHQLIQDVRTRWNSTFYMLTRLEEQKRAVTLYISENDVKFNNLSVAEWQMLEGCILLLKSFEEITKLASSFSATISEVIPNVNILIKYLSQKDLVLENITQMRLSLLNGIKIRFKQIESDKNYFMATLLDPRYRLNFFSSENITIIKNTFFLEALRRDLNSGSSSSDDSESDGSNNININTNIQQLSSTTDINFTGSHFALWDCYKAIATSNKAVSDSSPRNRIAIELDGYLSEELLKRDQDPFVWWNQNSLKYPNMSKLAKVYLSAPSSTVFSERLFSEAANIYEKKRNRLLPERAGQLAFLHENLELINYEY